MSGREVQIEIEKGRSCEKDVADFDSSINFGLCD